MSSIQLTSLNSNEQVAHFRKFNEQNIVRLTRQMYRQITFNLNKRLEICGYNDIAARHLSVFDNLDSEGTNIVTLAFSGRYFKTSNEQTCEGDEFGWLCLYSCR